MALSAAFRIYAPLTLELWYTDPAMKGIQGTDLRDGSVG
ncbi:hypothetical protein UNSWDHB_1785 [Dehalobacter sp. UNSWDHB]|nr:hypothetical protein DHBDCA_p1953 [Dehalobacter sp. DCA]AFV05966.1 hypothetical protein DCF50_p1964 [Dehalobacter sp. CF]EQB20890.1 hypothetical protein UNSWDHB_1785 [Dehalobacter sp. UNSWDHB]